MGKKSKKQDRRKDAAASSKEVEIELDDEYSPEACIRDIIKDAKELCPEAKEYYPLTRELFDNELWDVIRNTHLVA